MGQNTVHHNLQRNVSTGDGTGQLGQDDVELLLSCVSVNADHFITVDDNTNGVTAAKEVLGQRRCCSGGIHQSVARNRACFSNSAGVHDDDDVGNSVPLALVDHEFARACVGRPVDGTEGITLKVLTKRVEFRTGTGLSNVDGTGEDLRNTGLHKGLLEVLHLGEHEEVVVNVQFLFLVEQAKSILNTDGNRPEAVEASQWAFNGVLDEGLSARAEFHQDVVGTFLDSHDFRNTVTHFQNLGQR